MVTGYTKVDFDDYSRKEIQSTINAYKNYKKWFKFPIGIKGKKIFCVVVSQLIFDIFPDYEWKNKLRYVRIFFDTPTFDKITKDRAAKFVDMLSAIGKTRISIQGTFYWGKQSL